MSIFPKACVHCFAFAGPGWTREGVDGSLCHGCYIAGQLFRLAHDGRAAQEMSRGDGFPSQMSHSCALILALDIGSPTKSTGAEQSSVQGDT